MEGIQDSLGFWIPRPGFRIPGTGLSLSVEVAFRLPTVPIVSDIPDSLSCILDYKTPNSGFHEQEFPGYRIPQAKISLIQESGFPYIWAMKFQTPFAILARNSSTVLLLPLLPSPSPPPFLLSSAVESHIIHISYATSFFVPVRFCKRLAVSIA